MSLFELFIGFRYLKSKKNQGIISFNTILSIIIVCLGIFILIVVISLFSGMQSAIKDKILDVDSHITVINYPLMQDRGIRNYKDIKDKVETVKGVKYAEPYIESQALSLFRDSINPVAIRGMGGIDYMPEDVRKFIAEGSREFTGPNQVFIGTEMALNNSIQIGDMIELVTPRGRYRASKNEMQVNKDKFRVIGLFKTGYYQFDTGLIIMSIRSAQKLYDMGDTVTGVGAKINDLFKMDLIASRINTTITGDNYTTRTAEERNHNFFYALRLEKIMMTIILFLVIISALFTIMGTVVMVVSEKKRAIGILKSMGTKPRSIMAIFVLEGFFIGFIGSIIGTLLGLAAAINLEAIIGWTEGVINNAVRLYYGLFNLGLYEPISIVPRNIYYVDSIPTQINPEFIVTITVLTVFLSTVSAIFPAWHASRLNPVETIRYE